MNDVWAGASWSGIDIAGRWKPMQYAIKSAFATLQIQLVQDGAAIQVRAAEIGCCGETMADSVWNG
jgi:beta-mannosidase